MAEICRRKHRTHLKHATSITIALDESNTRKVLRYCCDTPSHPYTAHGLLGTLRLSYKSTDAVGYQEQMEEDHAVHALRALKLCLIRFCTRPTRTKRPRRTATAKATARTTVTAAARGAGGRLGIVSRPGALTDTLPKGLDISLGVGWDLLARGAWDGHIPRRRNLTFEFHRFQRRSQCRSQWRAQGACGWSSSNRGCSLWRKTR